MQSAADSDGLSQAALAVDSDLILQQNDRPMSNHVGILKDLQVHDLMALERD